MFAFYEKPVSSIQTNKESRATGVVLDDGREITAKVVLSNATARVTFLDLVKPVPCSLPSVCLYYLIIHICSLAFIYFFITYVIFVIL